MKILPGNGGMDWWKKGKGGYKSLWWYEKTLADYDSMFRFRSVQSGGLRRPSSALQLSRRFLISISSQHILHISYTSFSGSGDLCTNSFPHLAHVGIKCINCRIIDELGLITTCVLPTLSLVVFGACVRSVGFVSKWEMSLYSGLVLWGETRVSYIGEKVEQASRECSLCKRFFSISR